MRRNPQRAEASTLQRNNLVAWQHIRLQSLLLAHGAVITPAQKHLIKSAADLRTIAAQYTPIRITGDRGTGLCPFHKEKTPSLSVWINRFVCFGCEARGDAFTFIQQIEGINFQQAAELLAEQLSIPLNGVRVSREALVIANETVAFFRWWWDRRRQSLMREMDNCREGDWAIAREVRRTMQLLASYIEDARDTSPAWLCALGQTDCDAELDLIDWEAMCDAWEWAECCERLLSQMEALPETEQYAIFQAQSTLAERAEWRASTAWDRRFRDAWLALAG